MLTKTIDLILTALAVVGEALAMSPRRSRRA